MLSQGLHDVEEKYICLKSGGTNLTGEKKLVVQDRVIQFEPKGGADKEQDCKVALEVTKKMGSKPDGGDEEQDGEDDHQAVEHEDAGEEGGEQQSWRKKARHILDLGLRQKNLF